MQIELDSVFWLECHLKIEQFIRSCELLSMSEKVIRFLRFKSTLCNLIGSLNIRFSAWYKSWNQTALCYVSARKFIINDQSLFCKYERHQSLKTGRGHPKIKVYLPRSLSLATLTKSADILLARHALSAAERMSAQEATKQNPGLLQTF